jgi:hypothetical protein
MARIQYVDTAPVTINTPTVTVIEPSVTDIQPIVLHPAQAAVFGDQLPGHIVSRPIPVKRGRGRPATGVAMSDAERMRKYRDRRRADGLR